MAHVSQLMQLQTQAAYKRPLVQAASSTKAKMQPKNDPKHDIGETMDAQTVTTKRLKLAIQDSSSQTISMEEADELLMESGCLDSATRSTSAPHNINEPQRLPKLHKYKVPRTRTSAPPSSEKALQNLERTTYDFIFEDMYGQHAPKPTETQWITTQYRKDNHEGLLWMWTGRLDDGKKIFMPAVPGTVMNAEEDLEAVDRMLLNRR